MTLKARNAIVTGSTSGIGLAIARAFARDGANVMINGIGDAAAIEAVRAMAWRRSSGVTAVYSDAAMAKPDEIHAMVKDAEAKLGSVDILVNNAGVQHVAPIEEFLRENWDMIIAINLSAQGAQMGPHGSFARRFAIQVRICDGQTRPCRTDQNGGA